MERLTRKSSTSSMVWFVDHERGNADREPCEMDPHHARLAITRLAEYEDLEEQCVKENSWGLRMLLHKWKEFFEDIKELYEYRKLEEQGKLLKLPCKIGDTIYVIPSKENYKLNILNGRSENNRVYEQIVNRIEISEYGYLLSTCEGRASVIEQSYKKTWFLTKEGAEIALKKQK